MALIHCDFFSDVLGLSTAMTVILPQATSGQIGMSGAVVADTQAVYLSPADKSHRLTRRLSQGQKGLKERALMASQRPSEPW